MFASKPYQHVLCLMLCTIGWSVDAMAYRLNDRTFEASDFPLKLVFEGEPPSNLTHKDVEDAIAHAIGQWNDVQCSSASLVYAGRKSLDEAPDPKTIRIAFVKPGDDPCLPLGNTLIGITADICTSDHQAVILLNLQDYRWSKSPYEQQARVPSQSAYDQLVVDLPSVLTHELGHVLGLAHPDEGQTPQNERRATMVSGYLLDGGQASLAADDRLGLCTKYPNAQRQKTCQNDAQCVTQLNQPGAQCVVDGELSVCEEPRAGLGNYCAVNLIECTYECYLSNPEIGTGYCTIPCDAQTPCPEDYSCNASADGKVSFCLLDVEDVPEETGCQHTHGKYPIFWMVFGFGLITLKRRHKKTRQ